MSYGSNSMKLKRSDSVWPVCRRAPMTSSERAETLAAIAQAGGADGIDQGRLDSVLATEDSAHEWTVAEYRRCCRRD